MDEEYQLSLLKADIGLYTVSGPVEELLRHKLAAARSDLGKMGITLDDANRTDLDLVIMFAAWLYRKRAGNEPMPPMLRMAINDRKLGEVAI